MLRKAKHLNADFRLKRLFSSKRTICPTTLSHIDHDHQSSHHTDQSRRRLSTSPQYSQPQSNASSELSSNTVTMKMLHMVRSFRNRGQCEFLYQF